MADANKLIKQAEGLVARLERMLPGEAPPPDWSASVGFRWRRKNGRGHIEPVRHVHRIALRDLQGIDTQKALVEQNTRQFVEGHPANNVLLTGARGTGKSSLKIGRASCRERAQRAGVGAGVEEEGDES